MNNNDCIDLENVANADSKCPWCGAEVDGYEELTFVNYGKSGCGIEVTNYCDSCGTSYTLVYHLGEAVRDDSMDSKSIVASVFDLAVADMWNEPQRMGLKYCCEDVVNASATYAAQSVIYGEDAVRSHSLWPHTEDGYLGTDSELELYRTMLDASIEYAREHAEEHGIEFDDVWE